MHKKKRRKNRQKTFVDDVLAEIDAFQKKKMVTQRHETTNCCKQITKPIRKKVEAMRF